MADADRDHTQETGADRTAAFVLFLAVLAPVVGLAFGWDLALYAVELAAVAGAIAILVWNVGRNLPTMVRDALCLALAVPAIGLLFGWEAALVVGITALASLLWGRAVKST